MKSGFNWKNFFFTIIVSALPVVLSVAFGFYDFFVRDIEEGYMIIIIPIVFSPLYLGARFGLNFSALFWGCCLWMGLMVTSILAS